MELEGTAEHGHETIREHLAEGRHGPSSPRWFTYVALSTLLMALLSAFAALMAALSAHEALLERTQEIVDFVALETDRIEIEVLQSKHEILRQFDETPAESELARVEAYREDVARLIEQTVDEESLAQAATHAHLVLAVAVTLLSIGITLGGMAIIANQRFLWIIGLVFGLAGAVGVVLGLRDMMGL
jgi:hypothetical protein